MCISRRAGCSVRLLPLSGHCCLHRWLAREAPLTWLQPLAKKLSQPWRAVDFREGLAAQSTPQSTPGTPAVDPGQCPYHEECTAEPLEPHLLNRKHPMTVASINLDCVCDQCWPWGPSALFLTAGLLLSLANVHGSWEPSVSRALSPGYQYQFPSCCGVPELILVTPAPARA